MSGSKVAFSLLLALAIAMLASACMGAPPPLAPARQSVPPTTPTPVPTLTVTVPTVRVAPTPAPARMPTSTADEGKALASVEPEASAEPEVSVEPEASLAAEEEETVQPLGAIAVSEPRPGQEVTSPLRLEGTASVFEATVEFEVVAGGEVLGRGFTTASVGAPERGTFSAELAFEAPEEPMDGLLRVFSTSPKDGSVQNLVLVPLRLAAAPAPQQTQRTLLVYFARLNDGQAELVGVERTVPRTQAIGQAALRELLKGPTEAERAMGLDSLIPPGTQLRSLTIVDGVATADFDRQLMYQMGGSMRVQAIRGAIELTLLQFPSVQRVVITVEGSAEGVLEP